MAKTENLTEWLVNNPKLMGALWAMMILLSQVGNVVAQGAGSRIGP
ncbi:DUF7503 family protein [Halorussus pelagicus]|nr:hypothetical protein [Halorussus pelagicus]